MDLDIEGFHLFSIIEFADRTEYTFWQKIDLDITKIKLTEGQRLKWFTENDVKITDLAYGFNQIVDDFFKKALFADTHNESFNPDCAVESVSRRRKP